MKKFSKVMFVTLFCIVLSFGLLAADNSIISYNSKEGQTLLSKSLSKNFLSLSQNYETQVNRHYCGIASTVIVLNSLIKKKGPVDPNYAPFHYFTQSNIFTPDVLKIITPALVNAKGPSLEQEARILKTFDVNVIIYFADKLSENAAAEIIINAINAPDTFVIADISQPDDLITGPGYGHYSPLAAYNKETTKVLFLDVSRYDNYPYWINIKDLYDQMNTIDSDSNKSRGFLVVSLNPKSLSSQSSFKGVSSNGAKRIK